MKKTALRMFAAILTICSASVMTSCNNNDDMEYVKKNELSGQWIMEQRIDGVQDLIKAMGLNLPEGSDQLTFIYQFNDNGTGWGEIVVLKNGEYNMVLAERYDADSQFNYTIDANGKVLIKAKNNKGKQELQLDGKFLKWPVEQTIIPFTRASESQINKYKNATNAWRVAKVKEKISTSMNELTQPLK